MKTPVLLCAVSLLLASCGNGFDGNALPSTTLTMRAVQDYQSNYTTAVQYTDKNTGTVIPAGSSIICDNRTTTLSFSFTWSGDLRQAGVRFKGLKTKTVSPTYFSNETSKGDYSGSGTAEVSFGARTAPLSTTDGQWASVQAITVTPVQQIEVKGYSYVQVVGRDTLGRFSNVIESVEEIPVADCN